MSRTFRSQHPAYKDSFLESSYDGKKMYKPNKKFKQFKKSKRKAKEKQALRNNSEIIPEFPKSNEYDWL